MNRVIIKPDMPDKQAIVDVLISLSLFLLFIFISVQLGGWLMARPAGPRQAEPLVSGETMEVLARRVRNRGGFSNWSSPEEVISGAWLWDLVRDTQTIRLTLIALLIIIIASLTRSFRTSFRRKRIELIAEHTLAAAFVFTTIVISLSPFFAWIYHRWFFPNWRLNIDETHFFGILYPVLINELVVVLTIATFLAGALVGLLLILDPGD